MDIQDTRKCNHWNLQLLSRYLNVETDVLVGYYHELLENSQFINSPNDQVIHVREHTGFEKGIFKMTRIPSADWFAFERILIYVLIRHQRPEVVLETGVYYGGNSAFALLALQRNEKGRMISIDYPDSQIRKCGPSKTRHPLVGDSELYTEALRPGFIVPDYLKVNWHLIEGDSLEVIPNIDVTFDFYIHDSDHSMPFLSKELNAVFPKLSSKALILVDDIDWSNAFFSFCVKHRFYPQLFTDNGKDNLRVRTGIIATDHTNNGKELFT